VNLSGFDSRGIASRGVLEVKLESLLEIGKSFRLGISEAGHIDVEALSYIMLALAVDNRL